VVSPKVFLEEKEALLAMVNEFSSQKERTEWPEHPIFGPFTPEQWGKLQYKHLDHHLQQFNI
jgi:hypothetical protein